MGRSTAQRVRGLTAAVGLAALAVACSGPPGDVGAADGGAIDAPAPGDPDAPPAPVPPDAATPDAPFPDAAIPDATPPADADPLNPLGIRLVDVTSLIGSYPGGRSHPDPWGVGTGVTLADLDGDRDLDVVLARNDDPTSPRPGGPPLLLRNDGFPVFTSDPAFEAMMTDAQAHAAAAADYDGDGDLDLFFAMNGPDRLLENDGAGGFTDVTAAAGVAGPEGDVGAGALFADLNADGLLDLYVVNHVAITPPAADPINANRLYLNRGGGAWLETAAAAAAAGDGSSQTALVSDLDNDGELEIYVANDQFAIDGALPTKDPTLPPDAWLDLLSLDPEGRPLYFDCSRDYGTDGARSSMGIALWDIDGDSFDDIYVSDWGANHLQFWRPSFFRYVDEAGPYGVQVRSSPPGTLYVSWSARFVDLHRDSWPELFVVNGSISEPIGCDTFRQMDAFLRQPGAGLPFDELTERVGLPYDFTCPPLPGVPLEGRGAAFGDLDGDGDDDLVVSGYVEPYRFYRNDTPADARHHLRLALRGTVSSPDPAGAVVLVTLADGRKLRRTLYAGGDTHSQSARTLEVGLAGEAAVAGALLFWPSGYTQRLDAAPWFALDGELVVTEPEWLRLSARVAGAEEAAPVLTYTAYDEVGAPLGAAGAGRTVTAVRSDGMPAAFVDNGDGTYSALLPHPGLARVTTIAVSVDGGPTRPRMSVRYR